MKLSDYVKQNPDKTYQDIIGFREDVQEMLSPDMVVSLLTEHDSVLSLQEKALTDNKAAGFLLALNGSVKEYNVMNSHALGVKQQQLLAYLVHINAVTEDFKTAIIAEANKTIFPFQSIEQEEFDAVKVEDALYTDTPQRNTGYPELDSSQEWHVQTKNEKVGVFVFLDAPLVVDAAVDVYVDQYVNNTFVESPLKRLSIPVKAGETTGQLELTRFYGRFKVRAVCNVNTEFDVVVKAA